MQQVKRQRFYTVTESAEIFRCTTRTIYRWLADGTLRGKWVKDHWLIPHEEIEQALKDSFDNERRTKRERRQI